MLIVQDTLPSILQGLSVFQSLQSRLGTLLRQEPCKLYCWVQKRMIPTMTQGGWEDGAGSLRTVFCFHFAYKHLELKGII